LTTATEIIVGELNDFSGGLDGKAVEIAGADPVESVFVASKLDIDEEIVDRLMAVDSPAVQDLTAGVELPVTVTRYVVKA
jgi:hypothetical protein